MIARHRSIQTSFGDDGSELAIVSSIEMVLVELSESPKVSGRSSITSATEPLAAAVSPGPVSLVYSTPP